MSSRPLPRIIAAPRSLSSAKLSCLQSGGSLHRVAASQCTHGAADNRALGEISHRPRVMCPTPCLVHIAACCPISQALPSLRALCIGWIQRACAGRQAPVHLCDTSPRPGWSPLCCAFCCLGHLTVACMVVLCAALSAGSATVLHAKRTVP